MKDKLVKNSRKGFPYFFKNVALFLLLFLIIFVFLNPSVMGDPIEFFSKFNLNSIWGTSLSMIIVVALYYLSKDIMNEDRKNMEKSENKKKKEQHNELVRYRFDIGTKISNILKDLIISLDANRAGVLEMHNGTNNMCGVPFVFADFNYEEIGTGEEYMGSTFKELNLTRYPFFSNHFRDGLWFGTIDELKEEDDKFYQIMKLANCGYLFGLNIYGNGNIIGYLFVTFSESNPEIDTDVIMSKLNEASQKISTMLDSIYDIE